MRLSHLHHRLRNKFQLHLAVDPQRPETPSVTPADVPYRENPEVGPVNLRVKLERQAQGGPFEWPNIVVLNQTVVKLLGEDRQIVELGGGTGRFAIEAAEDPQRQIVCSEFDTQAHHWAIANRSRPNVTYVNGPVTTARGPFDVAVAIEVVEHITDYSGFLRTLAGLAPRALVTTPNRCRDASADHAGPPRYYQHVREWSAGEFYWVMRCFWKDVRLLAMPDPMSAHALQVDVDTRLTPLIADCRQPIES